MSSEVSSEVLSEATLSQESQDSPSEMDALVGASGGYDLQFRDVSYKVTTVKPGEAKRAGKDSMKVILEDINGQLLAGETCAIIGSSGAGKTSFLNILAGRINGKSGSEISGKIYQNGRERTAEDLDRLGFVTQDDVMLEMLTCQELLMYAADLQLHYLPKKERQRRVDEVLGTLRLRHCKDTLVGMPGGVKGLSGGERKRVNIAMSMLRSPSILLLDEPTSGLDSASALSLVKTLRRLAQSGRTVVTTIHQPSAEMYHMFDKIILLSQGRMVYCGPTERCVPFLADAGYECPEGANPAEFVLNLTDIHANLDAPLPSMDSDSEYSDETLELSTVDPEIGMKRIMRLVEQFEETKEYAQNTHEVEPRSVEDSDDDAGLFRRAPWCTATAVLVRREFKIISREPLVSKIRLGQTIVMSLIVGFLYFQVENTQSSIRDRQGALFFGSLNQLMSALMGTIFVFPKVRPVFLRETADGFYGLSSFYVAKLMSDIPTQTFFPFLFSSITYLLVGLDFEADKFFTYAAALIMMAHTGAAFGLLLSAGVSSAEAANSLGPLVFLPIMLFGGFFVKISNIPVVIRWMQYLSPVNYISAILFINEMRGQTFECTETELVTVSAGVTACPITTGDRAIEVYDYDGIDLWEPFVSCLALMVGVRLLGLFVLYLSHRRARYN